MPPTNLHRKRKIGLDDFAVKLGEIDAATVKDWTSKAHVLAKMLTVVDEEGNELDATLVISAAQPTEEELAAMDEALPEDVKAEDDEDAQAKAEGEDDEDQQAKAFATVLVHQRKLLERSIRVQDAKLKLAAQRITGGTFRNDDQRTFGWKNMGEQLTAIRKAAETGGRVIDQRLHTKAPSGLNETTDSDGGFLLAPDYVDRILEIRHEEENLLDRTDNFDIKGPSVKVRAIDETSRATGSRRGGVRAYWVAEADSLTSSKPKFREINMSPHKLAVLVYTTEELLDDGGAMLEQMVARTAAEEINFLAGNAIINGTGAGQPLGILNAACLISVSAESGQAASTLVSENLIKMHARLHRSARGNAVWLINQDVEPQLHALNLPVGTGGALVYMPPGGLSDKPFGTLYGRPVVVTEFNPTLGTKGDILLADLQHYLAVTRGAVKSAASMHVQFTTDEMAYRFTFRVDGQPWWNSALTPFQGSNTQSPFVALATRS